jgi:glycosyltransferase involved in cell wall biosynthesis
MNDSHGAPGGASTSLVGQRVSVDVVVPIYNEEGSLDEFYARVQRIGLGDRLIFVDNASTDGSLARIERYPDVRLIRHSINEGYGASIRDGFSAGSADLVIIIDADLEYAPETIPALLAALRDHPVVYASRFCGPTPPAMPLFRRIGNRVFSLLCNRLFGLRTTDVYTGMKGLRRRAVPVDRLRQNGFVHAAEIAALIALSGHRIHEVPVTYVPRQRGRSKMRHLPETLKLTGYILTCWFWYVVLRRPFGR